MSHKTSYGVVIVGAGFGGLGMGMTLRRKLGFDDFVIYERDCDVGGTWRANTYPGCASDCLIHAYGYSNVLKPDWPSSHGSQPQILDYITGVAEQFDLRRHCVFNTSVVAAEWDDNASFWRITIRDAKGEASIVTAKIFVSAMGILAEPNIPAIPGLDTFEGPLFHSARYRHDVDLRGQKVAVIGNGASAAQIVPAITQDPSVDVTVYSRTRVWYAPGVHAPYSAFWRKVLATVPFALRLQHIGSALYHEMYWFLVGFRSQFMNRRARTAFTNYMLENAPKEYVDMMMPDYDPGCRRLVFNNEYLSSLHRPNTTPVWTGVARIDESGVFGEDSVYRPCDVIVCATGFVTDKYPIEIRGRSGKTLNKYFEEQGGPTAYLGSTVPGFPNFMLIQGPNTTTGHSSVVFTEECQFDYATQLFKPILSNDFDSLEPTHEATTRYNNWLSARLSTSVFVQCASWYRAGGTGKIFSNFPGPVSLFWWLTLWPRWSDYVVLGNGKNAWLRKRRLHALSHWAAGLSTIIGILFVLRTILLGKDAPFSLGVSVAMHEIISWI